MYVPNRAMLKSIIISILFVSLFQPLPASHGKAIFCGHGKCYIRANYRCHTRLPFKCEPHTRCIRGRCRRISSAGQSCRRRGSEYRECNNNLVCISHVCRIKERQLCDSHPSQCRPGTACVGPKGRRKCFKPMGPGKRCKVDPYWFCQKNLLCQDRICRVGEGGSCVAGRKLLPCAKGLRCKDKVCRRLTGPGGKCSGTGQSTCQQGFTCERGICKVPKNKSCLRNGKPVACVSGTVCVGRQNRKNCKKPMGPGGKCLVDPFWVCLRGLKCQNRICKIPEKGDCSRATNQCVKGTKCVGPSRRKQCRRPNGPGGKCRSSPYDFCQNGLSCQRHVCHIKKNQPCDKNPNLCVVGTKCVGPLRKKRCKRPQGFGQKCRANSYHECGNVLTCDNGVCRIALNGNCRRRRNGCVKGAVCVGPRNNMRCRTPINVGGRCDANNKLFSCREGLVCDRHICRIQKGKSCLGNPDKCEQGTKCVGTNRRKLCEAPATVGMRCSEDNCAAGLICEGNVCHIRENGSCKRYSKKCAKGLHCVGTNQKMECRRPIPIGGQCDIKDPFNRCISQSFCDGGRCRIRLNQQCNRTPNFCARRLHCVGSRNNMRCRKPVNVGNRCNKDPKWTCRKGLVCEKHTCKLAEGGNCNNPRLTNLCVSQTKCVGNPGHRRCRKSVQLNGVCDENQKVCIGSLVCDRVGNPRRCKLPPNANCRKTPNSCVSGTRCVNDKCQRPLPAGGNCRKRGGGFCGANLVCQSDICRIHADQPCTHKTQHLCANGLACVVDAPTKIRRCKPAGTVLAKCNSDRKLGMQCQDGLMCDLQDDRCRIPADEECTANQSACRTGTECVGDPYLKVCTIPMEAGELCGVDPFWVCGDGLKCENNVCKVGSGGSCFIPFHECGRGLSCRPGYTCA